MARGRNQVDMINGSISDKLLLFAVPLMISSVLQLLFNAADIVVVGRFAGSASLAAVGSTSSLINLTVNLFIGLSVGANVVVARYLGANNEEGVSKTIHTSMMISCIGGVVIAIFGFFASRYLLELMGSPVDVIELSTLYLKIYFLGMPATMVYNFGAAILRAHGDTKRPLYYLTLAGVLNVLMNLFFVIILKMDVAGVALATIISQYVSATLIVICMHNEEGAMKLRFDELQIDTSKLVEIIKIGLPAGLQGTIFSLSNVVIQASVNSFGSIVIAGNSAASNIEGFVYASMNAFYQAAITFTSQNMGAKKTDRVSKILVRCQLMVVVIGLVLGLAATYFGDVLVGIYSNDPAVIEAGVVRLSIICRLYFLCGMMDVMVGSMRGIGYSVLPMIVSLCGACGFRLLWVATYFQMHRSISVLYASYPISWTITFLCHVLCFLLVRKKAFKKVNQAIQENA